MLFDTWSDDDFSKNLVRILAILTLGLTIFLATNTTIEKAHLYYLGISALIVLVAVQFNGSFLKSNFFGNKQALYTSVAVGAVLGTILGFMQRGGQLNLVLPTQALYIGDLSFIFANIVAPIVEPMFWRGIVFPTAVAFVGMTAFKKNKILAVIVALLASAYLFGYYHVNTYYTQGGDLTNTFTLMSFAALFAVFFTLGNSLFKCIGLELGWHFCNNLFSQGYAIGEILPTIFVAGVIFVILVEFTDRLR